MFQAKNRDTINVDLRYLKSCCVLQDHYDDERDKTVFLNTTPDLQFKTDFWSQTGLLLRPTVSDHITATQRTHLSCINIDPVLIFVSISFVTVFVIVS